MSEWKTKALSEIVEIEMGQSPKGVSTNTDEVGLPLLNGPTEFGSHHPTPVQFTTDPKKIAEKNDLLFCVRGSTTGRMNWADQRYAIGRGIAAFRHKHGSHYKYFLKGLIDFNLDNILSIATGSTFPNIGRKQLSGFEVKIPDLPTQRQIAAILSSLDDKIELNLQMNQTLENMAQAIFKEWFVDFNFPGSESEKLKGKSGKGELPKGWRWDKLGDVSKISIGRTPPRKETEWFSSSDKDFKWISIKDMGNSQVYLFETSEYLTAEAVDKFRVPKIPLDTVIVSFKLTVGRLAITNETMCSNEAIAQLPSNILTQIYIYLYLKNFNWKTLGSTSSIARAFNSKTLKNIDILVPDLEILKHFSIVINPIFEKIRHNTIETQSLSKLRDTLLPKLMSGQISLNHGLDGLQDDTD